MSEQQQYKAFLCLTYLEKQLDLLAEQVTNHYTIFIQQFCYLLNNYDVFL